MLFHVQETLRRASFSSESFSSSSIVRPFGVLVEIFGFLNLKGACALRIADRHKMTRYQHPFLSILSGALCVLLYAIRPLLSSANCRPLPVFSSPIYLDIV